MPLSPRARRQPWCLRILFLHRCLEQLQQPHSSRHHQAAPATGLRATLLTTDTQHSHSILENLNSLSRLSHRIGEAFQPGVTAILCRSFTTPRSSNNKSTAQPSFFTAHFGRPQRWSWGAACLTLDVILSTPSPAAPGFSGSSIRQWQS